MKCKLQLENIYRFKS